MDSQMESEGAFSRAKFDFTFWNNEGFFLSVECFSQTLNIKYWASMLENFNDVLFIP